MKPYHGRAISACHQNTTSQTTGKGEASVKYPFTLQQETIWLKLGMWLRNSKKILSITVLDLGVDGLFVSSCGPTFYVAQETTRGAGIPCQRRLCRYQPMIVGWEEGLCGMPCLSPTVGHLPSALHRPPHARPYHTRPAQRPHCEPQPLCEGMLVQVFPLVRAAAPQCALGKECWSAAGGGWTCRRCIENRRSANWGRVEGEHMCSIAVEGSNLLFKQNIAVWLALSDIPITSVFKLQLPGPPVPYHTSPDTWSDHCCQ